MRKYPSTLHTTFSPGLTRGDKKAPSDYFDFLKGKKVILTEKMDGEIYCLFKNSLNSC